MYYNEPITPEQLHDFVVRGLREDVREGDHTSLACVPADKRDRAILKVKQNGVLAGMIVAEAVFKHLDPTAVFVPRQHDGDAIVVGDIAFEVTCNSQALLQAERLVLNTMQRLSGIATASRRYTDLIKDLPVQLLDTRKTTPLLRFLEKAAVRLGGATNYRYGLYDRIMIKDNHIDACGDITTAIERAVQYCESQKLPLEITVEVRTMAELQAVLATGVELQVMLDNFSVPQLREAVIYIAGRLLTEASGGITLATLRSVAETGVNFISVGALTHSAGCLDLSLKVQR